MEYIELCCKLSPMQPFADILISDLSDIGYDSFAEEADGIKAYIESSQFDIKAVELLPLMQSPEVQINLSYAPLQNKNWNAEWESQYQAVGIANSCYIRAPFHEAQPSYAYDIIISPKMSFGTAHHETTAQMIEFILAEKLNDTTVLDMGSGTAVLAILAALKGAKIVDAIDNDEWAYKNTIENIAINHCETKVHPILGTADNIPKHRKYDLIIANIHKNILLKDMRSYVRHMQSGSKIFFSGFYLSDVEDMKAAAHSHGLQYLSHSNRNDWAVIAFQL